MTYKYCLDAGVFINGWHKHYHKDVFPSVWTHLHKQLSEGVAFVPHEIYNEVLRVDDEASRWLKVRKHCVRRETTEVMAHMKYIMRTYPRLVEQRTHRSGGDPFLIATAFVDKSIVVTEENFAENPSKPKIPDVCKDMQIECIKPLEFYRRTGLVL